MQMNTFCPCVTLTNFTPKVAARSRDLPNVNAGASWASAKLAKHTINYVVSLSNVAYLPVGI